MTKEEAIQVLKEYRTIVMYHLEAETPAFDMAIEALSAETHEIRTETHGVCSDLISRSDAIEAVKHSTAYMHNDLYEAISIRIPSAETTGALDDAIAKYVADGLMELPSADAEWIPCSERLPKAEDMYQPPEQRYLCQLEAHGVRKFCVLSRLKGAVSPFWDWYGIAVYDSEVTAWMPLPKPYREESEVEV